MIRVAVPIIREFKEKILNNTMRRYSSISQILSIKGVPPEYHEDR